jgi:uncharacterized protein involved in outer membrane biogenesis
MNKAVKTTILVVVVLAALAIAKNGVTQAVLTSAISSAANVPARIGSVNLSFLSASIRIKNFKLANPAGFPEKIMLDIPQIFIDFNPGALLKGRAHFQEVKLDLKELVVIKNKDGKTNVEAVKPSKQEKKEADQKAKSAGGGKATKLHIDKLSLSIGRVVYKDYSSGGEPATEIFDINIKDREFRDIDNPAQVVSLVMFETLTRTSLSRLAKLDIDSFKEGGIQALSKGLGAVSDGTDAAADAASQLLGSILN